MRWDRPHRPEEGDRPHETEVSDARIPRTPEDAKVWVPWSDLVLSPEEEARFEHTPLEHTPPEATPPDRGPAPERADEPGSWRGEGDQYLNHEENLVTDHTIDRIHTAEPQITNDLRTIETDLPQAELVGLEYRLKGEDRLKEKVATKSRVEPETPLRKIAEGLPDTVRFTYQFERDDYVQGYGDVRERLEARGYTMLLARNSWDTPDYKGINTRWTTPDGQRFEVQFHTPESFEAKQLTHAAYETIRSPATSEREKSAAEAYQRHVSAAIPVPEGVGTIADYRREGP